LVLGGKDRFRQFLGFLEAGGQLNAAHGAVLLVAFPAAAGNIAPHDAFHGDHGQLLALHALADKLGLPEKFRHLLVVHAEHMVGHNILRQVEPELGHLGQHLALIRDLIFQDHVKSGDPVRCHHDQAVACVINFPYLAGFKRFIFFHVAISLAKIKISFTKNILDFYFIIHCRPGRIKFLRRHKFWVAKIFPPPPALFSRKLRRPFFLKCGDAFRAVPGTHAQRLGYRFRSPARRPK
jgi:hypothetical protein